MLVALVEVGLDAVPVVDLDVVADLDDGGADRLEGSVLRRLHHAHLHTRGNVKKKNAPSRSPGEASREGREENC